MYYIYDVSEEEEYKPVATRYKNINVLLYTYFSEKYSLVALVVHVSSQGFHTGVLGASHRNPNVPSQGVPNTEFLRTSNSIFPVNSLQGIPRVPTMDALWLPKTDFLQFPI